MKPPLLNSVRRELISSDSALDPPSIMTAAREAPGAPLGGQALLTAAEELQAELTGAGVLQPLLADPEVSDVLVNGPGEVWVDRGAGLYRVDVAFADAAQLRDLATRLAASCGRRLDDATPYVDARLSDGTRFHAVLPPIAVNGPYLSLRTHRTRAFDLAALREAGTLTPGSARLLTEIIDARLSFMVTGGAGSGKTTLLASLLGLVDPTDRVVIVEDATELSCQHPHVVSLQSRNPNLETAGAVSMRDLVRQALRMRPDRIVLGECRGAEVVELLAALNTGHDGGAGTLHANTAADVPARLAALALPHEISRLGLNSMLASALRIIIHMRRTPTHRVVDEICLLDVDVKGEQVSVSPVWRRTAGVGEAYTRLRRMLGAYGAEEGG